jgi:hypothetical protein
MLAAPLQLLWLQATWHALRTMYVTVCCNMHCPRCCAVGVYDDLHAAIRERDLAVLAV